MSEKSDEETSPTLTSSATQGQVTFDFEPYNVKVFHLTSEALELLGVDIEKRHKTTAIMSSLWSAFGALALVCFVINDIRQFAEAQKLVMTVLMIVLGCAAMFYTISWFNYRKPIESIIKNRTQEGRIRDDAEKSP